MIHSCETCKAYIDAQIDLRIAEYEINNSFWKKVDSVAIVIIASFSIVFGLLYFSAEQLIKLSFKWFNDRRVDYQNDKLLEYFYENKVKLALILVLITAISIKIFGL